jgi:RNA polymerase sigma-70 factor (ECF subfamily)
VPAVDAPSRADTYSASLEDRRVVEGIRAGDERVFIELVELYGPLMLRVAMLYVRTRAVAEEVVQDAWLGALRGIDRFEGRSSFKTWLFKILTNTALSRAEREGRTLPFSSLTNSDLEPGARSVDPDQFLPEGDRWANYWASAPTRFDELPESRLLSAETLGLVQSVVETLPESQRAVLTMRDIAGFGSDEVCSTLGISEANQRVLLHRARTKVRQVLESYVNEDRA